MKTFLLLTKKTLKPAFCIFLSVSVLVSNAQSSTAVQSDNLSVQQGSAAIVLKPSVSTSFIKLAFFTAIFNNNRVELKFATELENSLSHIIVEISADGKNFKDAALVFTYENTSSRSDYTFADNVSKINSATVYYRLKSVDTDGATQYSDIHMIEITRELESVKTVWAYAGK